MRASVLKKRTLFLAGLEEGMRSSNKFSKQAGNRFMVHHNSTMDD